MKEKILSDYVVLKKREDELHELFELNFECKEDEKCEYNFDDYYYIVEPHSKDRMEYMEEEFGDYENYEWSRNLNEKTIVRHGDKVHIATKSHDEKVLTFVVDTSNLK